MLTSSQIETRIALRERRLLDIRKSMQSQSEYILELLHENGVRPQLSTGITAGYSVYSLAYAEWLRLFVEAEGLGREIDQLESLLP